MTDISIIISFYNNLRFLKLVLAGFRDQSQPSFNVIIADDGSRPEIVREIAALRTAYPFAIEHVWHQDNGWQKNRIINQAIAAAHPYLIFIDQDCVPHRRFVFEHYRNRAPGVVLAGRRANLSEPVTAALTEAMVTRRYLDDNSLRWLWEGLRGNMNYSERAFYLPWLRPWLMRKKKGLVGSNFSAFKDDILAVNGFDERYRAPTIGEDTDIEYRLRLSGRKVRCLDNLAIQYHLHHPLLSRANDNGRLFDEVRARGEWYTRYGIEKTASVD